MNDCNALAGDLSLVNAVSADSTLQVAFTYYTLDSYTAGQRRARVTSTSDALGEWVSIGAVVSVSGVGVCPVLGLYPPSGLFSGEVLLSDNVATAGDGDVWVRHGDALTVTYYDTDGVTPVDTHQVSVTLPSPPPAPGAGWLALVVLGTLFVLARVAVSRRRPAPSAAGTGVPPP